MNIEANIPNKILANLTVYIKSQNQVGFIPGMQGRFKCSKSIKYIKFKKEKQHDHIS